MEDDARADSGWEKTKAKKSKKESDPTGEHKVSLVTLSKMTNFPIDFIKSELVLKGDEISMFELRKTMSKYIEETGKVLFKR